MRIVTSLVFLFYGFIAFGQENAIQNNSLMAFVKNFEEKTLPFKISGANSENVIDKDLLKYHLDFEIDQEGIGYEEYYYGYVFYEKDFFGLIFTYYYTPGAFGINNYFIELVTLDYQGEILSQAELGCYCSDTNMGSNDYYASDLEINIAKSKIKILEKNTHATLIEEESENPFEKITTSNYSFSINSGGKIKENK